MLANLEPHSKNTVMIGFAYQWYKRHEKFPPRLHGIIHDSVSAWSVLILFEGFDTLFIYELTRKDF